MKNSRKKELRLVRDEIINAVKEFQEKIGELKMKVEDVYNELEEQYDNLSEISQDGPAGEKVQDDMYDVQEIIDSMEYISEGDADDVDIDVSGVICDINNLLGE